MHEVLSYIAENASVADAAIAQRVQLLKRTFNHSRWAIQCRPSADECLCSRGCPTSWLGCRPSRLCSVNGTGLSTDTQIASSRKVSILLYLTFTTRDVRHRYAAQPYRAYKRELRRIMWFLHTARRENVSLPIHVVVAGDRNLTAEAELVQLGAHILETTMVQAPRWTSSFHKFSFNRISALSFTQFDKVIVMDNDMAVLHNFDELAMAETPSLVWHTAAPFMLKLGELCAVTGGLFVLRPSTIEFARAVSHLKSMYDGNRTYRYDGSDQEFWRSFYRNPYELPIRYHATNYLKMPKEEWAKVRAIHFISGFKNVDRRIPAFVRNNMKYQK
ncbi:hypothetical protein AB1Y20_021726 [Prymnesium parvum]|uniref:Hexosyltransferase n=1 Tax=Prymnesium parvum TaxID=97485 RepID=A0AB34JME3_PRYPA